MLSALFEPRHQAQKDANELRLMQQRYGDSLPIILAERARNSSLGRRDRKHWQRLERKLPELSEQTNAFNF